jgi:hypothetical protein
MAHSFTRQELFDVVWSEPARTIAKRFGISDVGLAKACRRADLLMPPRGYWAKKAAGKRVVKPALPRRGPGMSDRITIGANRWGWAGDDSDELSKPDPPEPVFEEPLEAVAARVRRQIGGVRRTKSLDDAHSRILKLLADDERREARQRESPYNTWDPPLFESALERRRLALLNSIIRALDKVGVTVSIDGKEGRELMAHVGDRYVSFRLDAIGARPNRTSDVIVAPASRPASTPMHCQILASGATSVVESWTDTKELRLEGHLADIAVAIVVRGEGQYRESAHYHREWIIRRKAEAAEERRKQEEERLRLERERLARLEKARVDRLLDQAKALREAQEIRAYVEAVRAAQGTINEPLENFEMGHWTDWALSQADRIDPVRNGKFRSIQLEEDVTESAGVHVGTDNP